MISHSNIKTHYCCRCVATGGSILINFATRIEDQPDLTLLNEDYLVGVNFKTIFTGIVYDEIVWVSGCAASP